MRKAGQGSANRVGSAVGPTGGKNLDPARRVVAGRAKDAPCSITDRSAREGPASGASGRGPAPRMPGPARPWAGRGGGPAIALADAGTVRVTLSRSDVTRERSRPPVFGSRTGLARCDERRSPFGERHVPGNDAEELLQPLDQRARRLGPRSDLDRVPVGSGSRPTAWQFASLGKPPSKELTPDDPS